LSGGMIGAALYTIARDQLSTIDPVYWNFWIGLLLCVIVMSGVGGLVGILRRLVDRVAALVGKRK
jgi:branched-chain amino acid transport system permease protein